MSGTLEDLLAKPVTRRTQIAFTRFGGMVTVLVIASIVNLIGVASTMPFVDLTSSVTITAIDGTTTTAAGATVGDLFIDDAMMVNGLSLDILWPFALAAVALLAGWQLFLRRDLQSQGAPA